MATRMDDEACYAFTASAMPNHKRKDPITPKIIGPLCTPRPFDLERPSSAC